MAKRILRIGTRDSQLAIWQATQVKHLLAEAGIISELIFIKSEGDLDTVTPLYELGVQGIFTKSLDVALLNERIDLAVHSMKDVPTKLAAGVSEAAVLKRGSYNDVLVYKNESDLEAIGYSNGAWDDQIGFSGSELTFTVATSSIRRMAQWLHRYPHHQIENLRGNINTRLSKVEEHQWNGAIFAAAGLERINLRPAKSVSLDWMLPAPAQGAILIVCRSNDLFALNCCRPLQDNHTTLCTKVERDFLHALSGGCSTPVSALAEVINDEVCFRGNIASINGTEIIKIEKNSPVEAAAQLGLDAAREILADGGEALMQSIRNKQFS